MSKKKKTRTRKSKKKRKNRKARRVPGRRAAGAPTRGADAGDDMTTIIGWFRDDAREALRAARERGDTHPVALVLRQDDPLGRGLAHGLSGRAEGYDREAVVITAIPRTAIIEGLRLSGNDAATFAEATTDPTVEVMALVGHGAILCLPIATRSAPDRATEQQPKLTGEIAIYEGDATTLADLGSRWEPTGPLVLPALCLTPDGVLRLLTTDMLATTCVDLAVTALRRVLAERAEPSLTHRVAPGSAVRNDYRFKRLVALVWRTV